MIIFSKIKFETKLTCSSIKCVTAQIPFSIQVLETVIWIYQDILTVVLGCIVWCKIMLVQ